MRRWTAGLVIASAATLLGGLAAEVLVRLTLPAYDPGRQFAMEIQPGGFPLGPRGRTVRQATPKGDFDLQISFNALGLRDPRDWRQAPPRALVALGDSFTFGYGVQETERYSTRLEALLGEPVYNVALPENVVGYQRFLAYVESQGPRVERLVVGICMENDLQDYRDSRTVAEMTGGQGGARLWLQTHSALYLAASYSLQANPHLRALLERVGISRTRTDEVARNPDSDAVLEATRAQLEKIVAQRDATILIIPSRALWKGGNEPVERRMHDRFVALLRERGWRVADPRARFERDGRPLDFYFATDPHWNAAGHQVAAEELAAVLRR